MAQKDINKEVFESTMIRIREDASLASIAEKNDAAYRLLFSLVEELIAFSDIQFTTAFSQIVYLVNYYKLPRDISTCLHRLRRAYEDNQSTVEDASVHFCLHQEVLDSLLTLVEGDYVSKLSSSSLALVQKKSNQREGYIHGLRGVIVALDTENKQGTIVAESDGAYLPFRYDVPGENDIFTLSLESFYRNIGLPFISQFIHINIEEDILVPRLIIIDPDYLIDVTSVSESFSGRESRPGLSFMRKFRKLDPSFAPLLVGNIVNVLFDEIVSNPRLAFKDILGEIFKKYGLVLSLYQDEALKNLVSTLRQHFHNLKTVVNASFQKEGIQINHIYTEPSYYSVKYGLQGRLDLLHEDDERIDIIELKSGSPYMSNTYGLSTNHYVQSLMYDLMLESAARKKKVRRAYILYSKVSDGLRYAPAIMAQQMEALVVRNMQVLIEHLIQSREGVERMIARTTTTRYADASGFLKRDIEKFEKIIQKLSTVEYSYFVEFTAFLAREHKNNKTGRYGRYTDNGLSNIWTLTEQEKEERFSLMKKCTISDIIHDGIRTSIILTKSVHTNPLSNFRVGDIIILYPHRTKSLDTIRSQIFKCTLVEHDASTLKVQLRGKVYNMDVFHAHHYWNIEPDILDSSFGGAYRSLFAFLDAPRPVKEKILGLRAPASYSIEDSQSQAHEGLTDVQKEICKAATASQDYFLVWGPPGTGKTSKLLRSIVADLYQKEEVILLLAYTNKAVDEICLALSSIAPGFESNYLRVGSLHGCGKAHQSRLMDEVIRSMQSRTEIVDLLQNTRIIVGTISSVLNRPSLFKLVKFTRLIIDEASQILEPMLVHLLTQIPHWILIGDHRQLPAVVTQDEDKRKVQAVELKDVGIDDLGLSLFERLYKRCIDKKWNHALGMLTAQGRMHEDIAYFPSTYFYEGRLKNLPIERLTSTQPFVTCFPQRILYVDTMVDDTIEWKTNIHEAKIIVDFILQIIKEYAAKNTIIDTESIGIITPYRAQIALIKSLLMPACGSIAERITVDTVERYQGGARDIILYSLCSNNTRQFERLVGTDSEGVDRKLNVALTRAREQLIILGNKSILDQFPTYNTLIAYCTSLQEKN